MFRLKGKMMWLFAVFSIGLVAVGFYFYNSLTTLGDKVESTLTPNKGSDHLKKIMVDLNKLNNLYLVDSERIDHTKLDSLIYCIEKNIEFVNSKFSHNKVLKSQNLDTIPSLLREITNDYYQLEISKNYSQKELLDQMKVLIESELSKAGAKQSDSITIVKQINSEIYEKVETTPRVADDKSFFQKLFSIFKSDKKATDTIVSKRDTLTNQSIDTLISKRSINTSNLDISPAIRNYQIKKANIYKSLKEQEQQIFKKNILVNNYVENTLNEILFEEYEYYKSSISNLKNDSIGYIYEIGVIIIILILISISTLFIILKDINKNIYYQKRLRASEKQAQRTAIEKQKFLSTMSHELRTPLTSIIGYSDLLDDKNENVKSIKTASNYLYQMTNEILDMAKIQAGIIEVYKEATDISLVFHNIKQSFSKLIKNQNLKPIFIIPNEAVYVKTDAHRIQQILYNLMHNALKYTEKGFIMLKVSIITKNNTTSLKIEVEDSGVGMTDAEKKSVFKDYQQAGTHKNKMKGTGLGLGIVKNLVKELGGRISVESEPNKGSNFKLNFDLETAEKASVKPELNKFLLPKKSLKEKNIFILDDDRLISRLYEKILEPYHPKLVVFNDAMKAYEHLFTYHHYDLFIIDFKMPLLSGYDLLSKLKENGIELKNTIVSTANVMLSDREKQELNAFDARVSKPIKAHIILEKISQLLKLDLNTTLQKGNCNIETQNLSYNLDDLSIYAGEDKSILKDLVQTLVDENEIELQKFKKALDDNQHSQLAGIIHKLSSRFAQVKAKPIKNLTTLEQSLRENLLIEQKQSLIEIYHFWKTVNNEMKNWLNAN